jgi:hypothetical protein
VIIQQAYIAGGAIVVKIKNRVKSREMPKTARNDL